MVGDLNIETQLHGDTVVVRVGGEIDLASAPLLDGRLQAAGAGGHAVVVDLTEVAFVDVTGVRVLLRHAQASRGGTRFLGLPGHLRRVLALAGLDDRLPMAA